MPGLAMCPVGLSRAECGCFLAHPDCESLLDDTYEITPGIRLVQSCRRSVKRRRGGGSRVGEPITQFCGKCKKRKPITGFDVRRGLCSKCSRAATAKELRRRKKPAVKDRVRPVKNRKCPLCLQFVSVISGSGALVKHLNSRQEACRGSGSRPRRKGSDAMDYRVGGSFEGGKR